MRKVFTHLNVDLDAVASVWFVTRFLLSNEEVEIHFVSANWDGAGMEDGDLAVDIEAGGRGLKGRSNGDGLVHSCFSALIQEHCSFDDQQAMATMESFIDAQDTHGSALEFFIPNAPRAIKDIFALTGINAVLRAFQSVNPGDDFAVYQRMAEIFDGMFRAGQGRMIAETEAKWAEVSAEGRVAIVRGSRRSLNTALFNRGVEFIIYVDGNNLGVIRRNDVTVRADNPILRQVVAEAGEEREWYAHPSGFLFCRGSRKAPAETPSKVKPEDLAAALATII